MEMHAFYNAVLNRDLKKVEALLTQPIQDVRGSISKYMDGKTPLYVAAKEGYTEIVAALLRCPEIQVNKGTSKRSPLYAASRNGHAGSVQLLLEDPRVDVNHISDGRTALYIAVSENHLGIIKLLLRHPNLDINRGWNGYVPLYIADKYSNLNAISLLLLYGVEKSIQSMQNVDRVDFTIERLTEVFSYAFGLALLPQEQAGVSQFFLYLMRQPHRFDEERPAGHQLPSIGEMLSQLQREAELINDMILQFKLSKEIINTIFFAVDFYLPELVSFWGTCLEHDWMELFPACQLPRIDWNSTHFRAVTYKAWEEDSIEPCTPDPSFR